jgi:Outer membrane protein beta-barrel domain
VKPTACLLTLLSWSCLGGAARAAGEKEWQLAGRTGAATISVDGRTAWGFAAAADLEYGLTDSWAVRGSLATSFHSVNPESASDKRPSGRIQTSSALAGLTYTIDVLRLVPYADLQLGASNVRGAVVTPKTAFVSALGLGADYYITRRFTTGIYFQYLFAPLDLVSNPLNLGSSPYGFSVTLRVSRIF